MRACKWDAMTQDRESAARYRQHARNLRSIANVTKDPKVKQALLEIADGYEELARTRERMDRSERSDGQR